MVKGEPGGRSYDQPTGNFEDTTLNTWLNWFPERQWGKFNFQKMTHNIKYGDVDMEVLFRSLDRPGDIGKLLSLELTWAWVNEAKQIYSRVLIDGLIDTLGQYPAKKDGGCKWHGLIMDTNSFDTDHWLYGMAEEHKPDNWEFFHQPGGVIEIKPGSPLYAQLDGKAIEKDGRFFTINPKAENLDNLNSGGDYYLTRLQGHTLDYILVYYCNQYGFVKEGTPVHEDYNDAVHCVDQDLKPVPGSPIVVGLDFGLTPAAALLQRQASGQWIWFDEITTQHIGTAKFGELLLKPKLAGECGGFEIDVWGDPAGSEEAQANEETCFQILNAMGIPAKPAPSQDPTLRREAMRQPLRRMIGGRPGIILGKRVKEGRKGLGGAYCYKKIHTSMGEKTDSKPDKTSMASHICEAAEYALLGAGEGRAMIRMPRKPKVDNKPPAFAGAWMR